MYKTLLDCLPRTHIQRDWQDYELVIGRSNIWTYIMTQLANPPATGAGIPFGTNPCPNYPTSHPDTCLWPRKTIEHDLKPWVPALR